MTLAAASSNPISRVVTRAPALFDRVPLLSCLVLAHIPLAVLLVSSPVIATVHAIGALFLGLFFLRDEHAERVVYVAAYIVAAELLWRGAGAVIFWEFGKYAAVLLLGLALVRYRKWRRAEKLPILFFLLLMPSLLVLPYFDREELAFNLSGPLSLAVATAFFSAVRLERSHLTNLFLVMLGPILGLATLSAVSTLNTDLTTLVAGSKATTGGIGPNQVSTILGLGILLGLLLPFLAQGRAWLKVAALGALIWLTVQCLVSFSRGGLWAALGAVLVAGFYLLQGRRFRGWALAGAVALALLLNFALLPALNKATAGLLEQRFTDTRLTGRDLIVRGDLAAFRENPILGVGPGRSRDYHAEYFRLSSSHTEYSRLLAEHGIFGAVSVLALALMTFRRLVSKQPPLAKATSLGFTFWALLTMVHSAMRLSTVGFIFGLGAAWFTIEPEADREAPR